MGAWRGVALCGIEVRVMKLVVSCVRISQDGGQFLYRYKLLIVWWCFSCTGHYFSVPYQYFIHTFIPELTVLNRLYNFHFYIPHTREISDAYLQTVSAWVIPVVFSASCIALPNMFMCSVFCICQGSHTHDLWAASGPPVNFMWLSRPVVIIKCRQTQCWKNSLI